MKIKIFLPMLAALILSSPVLADDKTAFELIKEGNRHVGETVKNRVVQIRSEKSVGGVTPAIWYVVYRDETATLKATEVKFGAGKMMDVKRPMRLLEPVLDKAKELDHKKLKVDSDKAIKLALKEPLLEKLTVTATQLKLEDSDAGPVWKVRLWVQRLKKADKDVEIGQVHLLAEDGKVVKNDINLNKLD